MKSSSVISVSLRNSNDFGRRLGITITEVLVVTSVIAVLLSIAVPAVQVARSASRAVTCKNNLRQVGAALQQYIAISGQFPVSGRGGSTFVVLSPYLTGERLQRPNVALRPSVLVCPESSTIDAHPHGTCYAENRGICRQAVGRLSFSPYPDFDGPIQTSHAPSRITPASIVDGLSHTACYAEILPLPHPKRSVFRAQTTYRECGPPAIQVSLCESYADSRPNHSLGRGRLWQFAAMDHTGYVHVMPPNGRDCIFIPVAASDHNGGANALLCDGSVVFASSVIATSIWQALGSRNGKEVISDF
jgi:prepilin-type processing-associated H-X9-DG protein